MKRLSNPHGQLFIELGLELSVEDTTSGWLGKQQTGQARNTILDLVSEARGVVIESIDDTLHCSFPNSQRSLDAAISIQAHFAPPNPGVKRKGVTVRQAITYGAVTVTEGATSGQILIDGRTLLEHADVGDIVISDAAHDSLESADQQAAFGDRETLDGVSAQRINEFSLKDGDDLSYEEFSLDSHDSGASTEGGLAEIDLDNDAQIGSPSSAPSEARGNDDTTTHVSAEETSLIKARIVLSRNDESWSFDAEQKSAIVGRGSDCDVRVINPHVSRRHAQLRWTETSIVLINLSANGTVVRFDDDESATPHEDPVDLKTSGEIALGHSFDVANAEIIRFRVE